MDGVREFQDAFFYFFSQSAMTKSNPLKTREVSLIRSCASAERTRSGRDEPGFSPDTGGQQRIIDSHCNAPTTDTQH